MNNIKTGIKNESAVNLISGYAPADMHFAGRFLYTSFRMVHLISTGAVLPLAIIYTKYNGNGSEFAHPVLGWFLAFGAMFWILLFVALEQYSYPPGVPGAFGVTGGMILNAFSGYTLSGLNIYYGAYQVVISALCAQFLFLALITIRYTCYKIINSAEVRDMKLWYLVFLALASLSVGLLLISMIKPVQIEFSDENNPVLIGISAFFFLYHVFSDGVTLWKGSIFNKNIMFFPLRNQLHEKWSAFSAITIIASLFSSAVIGLWNMS